MTFRARLRAAVTSLGTALRDRDIAAVEASWTLGLAGDTALLVVGLLVAYDMAGALGIAALAAARMVPATTVTLLADVHHLGRLERVLVAAHLGSAAGAALVAAAIAAGAPAPVVLAAMAIAAGTSAIIRPVQLALFPALAATPAQLLSANAAMSLGEGLGAFAGPLLAGIVAAGPGQAPAAAASAGLALAAALVLLPVRVSDAARLPRLERRGGPPVVHGARTLAARPAAAAVIASFGLQVVVRGALTTLLVLLAIEVLGAGEAGVGALNAAIGLGGLAGAVAALALGGASRLARAFSVALALWGVPIALAGLAPSIVVAVAALAAVGVANALLDVSGFTLLQRGVPLAARAAVFAVLESLVGVGILAGGLAAPVLAGTLGVRGALVATGVLLPIAAILGARVIGRLDDAQVVPGRTAALLRGIPLFSLLPLDALERLAAAMTPARFAPGERLMAEGEPGDRYLVIASGGVAVSRGGREVRRLGPGAGVGEIALLRSVPRTASVTALGEVEAFELDAPAFLAAVTGHAGARTAASAEVRSRLEADATGDAG